MNWTVIRALIFLGAAVLAVSCDRTNNNSPVVANPPAVVEEKPAAAPEPTVDTPVDVEGVAEFVEKKNGRTAKIVFETRKFDPAKHRIRRETDPEGGCQLTIDGRSPLGAECSQPIAEIVAMKFFLDGREIPVSPDLYADCFSPPYFKDYQKRGWMDRYLNIKFSDDGQSVFVFMMGGDGAGTYSAIWVLRPDGKHTRFTTSGGDCTFLDFSCAP